MQSRHVRTSGIRSPAYVAIARTTGAALCVSDRHCKHLKIDVDGLLRFERSASKPRAIFAASHPARSSIRQIFDIGAASDRMLFIPLRRQRQRRRRQRRQRRRQLPAFLPLLASQLGRASRFTVARNKSNSTRARCLSAIQSCGLLTSGELIFTQFCASAA